MRIAIAGYGVEGRSNYTYWNTPENSLTIVDERTELDDLPDGAEFWLGQGAFEKLADFDMVIRSAGVAPRKIATNGKIWSATNEFFAKCPAPIIGVTGTKGKGTTCSLIASILRKAGKTVHLVGNIGTPALDVLPEIHESDIVVYELSSFQLWDLEKSPCIAVVLMIEPDHLDVHEDLGEYVAAKKNIRRYQRGYDSCFYHPTNELSRDIASTELVHEPTGSPTSIDLAERYAVPDDGQAYVKDGFFCVQDRKICSIDHLKLPGAHNLENACAAISAISELSCWSEISDEMIARGLADFTGLDHRLKFVREVGGVKYYDDSIATTPGSAIAALRSFDQPKIIILGGSEKGADYAEIIETAKEVRARVIAIGQTGRRMYELCKEKGVAVELLKNVNMRAIVKKARMQANSGDVVILSPASASFDMFKNAKDRGDQFVTAVEEL